MALPNKPLTRGEQYLNRIATGGGTIPDEPLTRVEQYLDYIAKNGGGGSGGGGSGGGVLMVTDNDGTLDKTMGEIQDAYLAGKRVIISDGHSDIDVIGIIPVQFGKGNYFGRIQTYIIDYVSGSIDSKMVLVPMQYYIFGKTEEAARNAYPARQE